MTTLLLIEGIDLNQQVIFPLFIPFYSLVCLFSSLGNRDLGQSSRATSSLISLLKYRIASRYRSRLVNQAKQSK